jgi:hypothetical protein
VENSDIFPDSSFTSSSSSIANYVASKGRLGATYGWAPRTNTNPNDYLQIDLGLPYIICAIATQGNTNYYEWVTAYKISVSLDVSKWTTYQDSGADKVSLLKVINADYL